MDKTDDRQIGFKLGSGNLYKMVRTIDIQTPFFRYVPLLQVMIL